MTNTELIAAATARLRNIGVDIPDKSGVMILSGAIDTIGIFMSKPVQDGLGTGPCQRC